MSVPDRRPDRVVSERAAEPVGAFPHARRVGNLLFLSGIGPRLRGSSDIPGVTRDAHGNVVDHDIEAQCRAVFANVRAVLEDSGSSWERIVDVTVFLTDMRRDFAAYNRLWAEHFASNQPARTTVEVNRLPTPIAIELKVIATVPPAGILPVPCASCIGNQPPPRRARPSAQSLAHEAEPALRPRLVQDQGKNAAHSRWRMAHRSGKTGRNSVALRNSTPLEPPVPTLLPMVRSTILTWR
jgi:2-aminomuconate deaminase